MSAAQDEPFGSGTQPPVAVLGVGGVGGALAAHLAHAGCRVVCVVQAARVEEIVAAGVRLETPDGVVAGPADAVERLEEPASVLVVAVKAPALGEALERIERFAVADGVVLPLLNGLEHPDAIRRQLGDRVAPGSISRFEGYRADGGIVQTTRAPQLTIASDDLPVDELERALDPFRRAGVEGRVGRDERAVLWEKAARMGPLAAATVAAGLAVGPLRTDAEWGRRLRAAVVEACAVAAADGVELLVDAQLGIIDAMPESLTTSTARDVAAGRPSELDAIAGSVVRAAERLGVAAPELGALLDQAEAVCRAR